VVLYHQHPHPHPHLILKNASILAVTLVALHVSDADDSASHSIALSVPLGFKNLPEPLEGSFEDGFGFLGLSSFRITSLVFHFHTLFETSTTTIITEIQVE